MGDLHNALTSVFNKLTNVPKIYKRMVRYGFINRLIGNSIFGYFIGVFDYVVKTGIRVFLSTITAVFTDGIVSHI